MWAVSISFPREIAGAIPSQARPTGYLCHRHYPRISDMSLLFTLFGEHKLPDLSMKQQWNVSALFTPVPTTLIHELFPLHLRRRRAHGHLPHARAAHFSCAVKQTGAPDKILRKHSHHFCLSVFKKSPRDTPHARSTAPYSSETPLPSFLFCCSGSGTHSHFPSHLPPLKNSSYNPIYCHFFRAVLNFTYTTQGGSHTKRERKSVMMKKVKNFCISYFLEINKRYFK